MKTKPHAGPDRCPDCNGWGLLRVAELGVDEPPDGWPIATCQVCHGTGRAPEGEAE